MIFTPPIKIEIKIKTNKAYASDLKIRETGFAR